MVDVICPLNVPLVAATVLGVVAPTVPLMLIEAVPLAFVRTIAEGVPRAGVTRVGLLESTTLVVPVEVVTPVPPEATAIGVEALTVVKAPVDGLEAPIAVFVRPTAE